jgi:hypothetical protein
MDDELTSLRSEYKDFDFGLAPAPGRHHRFEAVRARGDQTLWVVITADAAELRQILDSAALA